MKIQLHPKDAPLIHTFLAGWMNESQEALYLISSEETEPLYLDCSAEELANAFDALTKKGFLQSCKALFCGDHFYRRDTGKCPRCYRYRPELHWNNEHLKECKICDRCVSATKKGDEIEQQQINAETATTGG